MSGLFNNDYAAAQEALYNNSLTTSKQDRLEARAADKESRLGLDTSRSALEVQDLLSEAMNNSAHQRADGSWYTIDYQPLSTTLR